MSSDFGTFDDLDELYQQLILDHSRHPRNLRELENASGEAEGYNPLCGDQVTVRVREGGEGQGGGQRGGVAELAFTGKGCAICTASASMMTQALKGESRDQVLEMFQQFHDLLTSEGDQSEQELGKLAVFAGVKKYPIRVKCATLPWHTLKAALEQGRGTVTTE